MIDLLLGKGPGPSSPNNFKQDRGGKEKDCDDGERG